MLLPNRRGRMKKMLLGWFSNKGKISAAQAKKKAEEEYDIFNKTQRIDSDFDKEIRGLLGKE